MPSVSQKQHNFMAGVAKSPSFAKKIGVDRKVGEEFLKADRKNDRFMSGGTDAGINKQNTHHGKMDMPYSSLNKRAGMAQGGNVRGSARTRKFDIGGGVSTEDWLKESTKDYSRKGETLEDAAARRAAANAPIRESVTPTTPSSYSGEADDVSPRSRVTEEAPTPRVTSSAPKAAAPVAKAAPKAAPQTASKRDYYPAGNDQASRAKSGTPSRDNYPAGEDSVSRSTAKSKAEDDEASKPYFGTQRKKSVSDSLTKEQRDENAKGFATQLGIAGAGAGAGLALKGINAARAVRFNKARESLNKPGQRTAAKYRDSERTRSMGELDGYKKGGAIMKNESKAMVKKEVDFFKKKGAPKSMIKHEEKEMNTAKFAKGGGIESRGKTKGKVIKMAVGGAVGFARGGGIEQRGKTRGKMC